VKKVLRLAHLYPRLMNIYGDRGNILCLRRRCDARDIELAVEDLDLGDPLDPAAYDLIFMGG
jgi:CobQ-like glutamine amidotransferase family enzyme